MELNLQKKCFDKVIKRILPVMIKFYTEIDARDLRHITTSIGCIKEARMKLIGQETLIGG